MSILYIGNSDICLTDNSFSRVIYQAKKDEIQYDKLISLLPKTGLKIFINSFFAFSEHRQIVKGISDDEIQQIIDERLLKKDVVCASYNHLFAKGKGDEHTNDVVFSIVKFDESEVHIQKILNRLVETEIDLGNIYSFGQTIHTIGLNYSMFNKNINVNVSVLDSDILITVSNTTHFMFGRLMKLKLDGDINAQIAKLIVTVIKYINTTYPFLKFPLKVNVMTSKDLDDRIITMSDAILDKIKQDISIKKLSLPSLGIAGKVPDIATELQVLKMAMPNIGKVNIMSNTLLNNHRKTSKFIHIFKLVALISLAVSGLYCVGRLFSSATITKQDERLEKEYDKIEKDYRKQEKVLINMENNIYLSTMSAVAGVGVNNNHIDTMKDIAGVFRKYKDFIYVEQYKIDCENCSDKRENRKYIFTADIALYNVNESIKFAVLKFADLENSIRDVLKQKYKVVEIEFKNTSVNKRYAGSKDVRDTIIVKFSN